MLQIFLNIQISNFNGGEIYGVAREFICPECGLIWEDAWKFGKKITCSECDNHVLHTKDNMGWHFEKVKVVTYLRKNNKRLHYLKEGVVNQMQITYTGFIVIVDILMWVLASIFLITIFVILEIWEKITIFYQRSRLGKFLFFYECKIKFRKYGALKYKEEMTRWWRGGFILDNHIKKIITEKEYKAFLKERQEIRELFKDKLV